MRPNEVVMTRMKGKQAQLEVVSSSPKLIEDVKLNLKRTINTGLTWTTGCLILPDGRFVLSCGDKHLVRVFTKGNTISATSRECSHHISIIDIKNRNVSKQVKVNFLYYGVVYSDFKLITCAKQEGLHILKNRGSKVDEEIKIKEMSSCSYAAAFGNKRYYTNCEHHTVTCCDMKGTELWTFKDMTGRTQKVSL
ncbi:unnamed protein product [Mytilus coruscus]|uniref:Uncharacterized protein n=1 Tax=Mytilus coruscus TaxID=42192 RepID=A0A6J8C8Q4_MYTCO|nr:unnamed protein product [Mytilus coruscus]